MTTAARALFLALPVVVTACGVPVGQAGAGPALSISVSGDHFVNQDGQTVVLRGVNTSGSEFACVKEGTIFDGSEQASAGSISAMRSWGFNAVRVQLNESCWLGIQRVAPAVSGQAYRSAIELYVHALVEAGMYVIVDLHWSSKGGGRAAKGQEPMPDERYAPELWRSVATAFKSDPAVLFDLFNEPYPNRNSGTAAAWQCELEGTAGGACRGIPYQTAGMQQLVDVVRAAQSTNVILVGGPQYAQNLSGWAQYEPHDPAHQLAASVHIYWGTPTHPDVTECSASSCWSSVLAPLATQVPVVVGEFGEFDCGDSLYPPFLTFADHHGISYLGWAWFVGSCSSFPSMIANYAGTPTAFGAGYRAHLSALGG